MKVKHKIRRLIFIAIFCFSYCAVSAFAKEYFVSKEGDDRNPGSLSHPWRTIGKANQNISLGDTVTIRAGTYKETIEPRHSGSENKPITYTNYENEKVVITDVLAGVHLLNVDFIHIRGIHFNGKNNKNYRIKWWLKITDGSSYNVIENCMMTYAEGWHGVEIGKDCNHNKILNNTLSYCGWPEPPAKDDYGNCVSIFGSYNLLEGNDISYGGHNLFELRYGSHNILRNNNFHSHWGRCGGISVDPDEIDKNSRPNVIERNKITFAKNYHDDRYPNPGMQCNQSYAIIRLNEFYQNYGHGLTVFSTKPEEGSFTKIYHNVFYKNGHNDRNIRKEAICIADWTRGKYPGEFHSVSVINNIFYENNRPDICFDGKDNGRDRHIIEGNLMEGNPIFENPSEFNFVLLQKSPCIDRGKFLTKTDDSGSGVHIKVNDAGFFCDGFGLVDGDLVQLEGNFQEVRIVEIDYKENTITVDKPITWEKGQGVSLAYAGTAPEIGTYEFIPGKKGGKSKR